MKIYRVGMSQFSLFDGSGAYERGARWTGQGRYAIYCAQSVSAARWEWVANLGSGALWPVNMVYIEINVPADIESRMEVMDAAALPQGWDDPSDYSACRSIGNNWFDQSRSLILSVPSVAAKPDKNFIINQLHPDFARLQATQEQMLEWDRRLFSAPGIARPTRRR